MSIRTNPQLAPPMPLRPLSLPPAIVAQRRRQAKDLNAAGTPIGGLPDPRFVYVDADHTDISKTFARIRREQQRKGEMQ